MNRADLQPEASANFRIEMIEEKGLS